MTLLPAGWWRAGGARGRPAATSAAWISAESGRPAGVPVRSSRITVSGTVKAPFTGCPCVTSWMRVGPTLPTAAVRNPLARARARSDVSPRKLPPGARAAVAPSLVVLEEGRQRAGDPAGETRRPAVEDRHPGEEEIAEVAGVTGKVAGCDGGRVRRGERR